MAGRGGDLVAIGVAARAVYDDGEHEGGKAAGKLEGWCGGATITPTVGVALAVRCEEAVRQLAASDRYQANAIVARAEVLADRPGRSLPGGEPTAAFRIQPAYRHRGRCTPRRSWPEWTMGPSEQRRLSANRWRTSERRSLPSTRTPRAACPGAPPEGTAGDGGPADHVAGVLRQSRPAAQPPPSRRLQPGMRQRARGSTGPVASCGVVTVTRTWPPPTETSSTGWWPAAAPRTVDSPSYWHRGQPLPQAPTYSHRAA